MKILTIALFFISTFIISATAQSSFTLREIIDISVKNNLTVKQSKISLQLSEVSLKESHFKKHPTIDIYNNFNINSGRSIDPYSNSFVTQRIVSSKIAINSRIPIFEGLKRRYEILQAKSAIEGDKSTIKKDQNELIISLILAYIEYLAADEQISVVQKHFEFADAQLKVAKKKKDIGMAIGLEVAQATANLKLINADRTSIRNQQKAAKLKLAQLMEWPYTDSFTVVKPTLARFEGGSTYIIKEVFELAAKIHPDLRVAQYKSSFEARSIDIAKASRLPKIFLQFNMSSGYSSVAQREVLDPLIGHLYEKAPLSYQLRTNYSPTIGLTFSLPITNNYTTKAQIERAKLRYEGAKVSEQMAKNNLYKAISQAIFDLDVAANNYHAALASVSSLQEAIQATEERYKLGLVNFMDLNRVQDDLLEAELSTIRYLYESVFREKIIALYMGKELEL